MIPRRCAALLALLWAASSAAPAGFAENDGSGRPVLLSLLPDLRVFVDLKTGEMPRNFLQGELSAAEVREAAALGIGNWASVLPDMRFRLVSAPESANLVLRFRDYGSHITGGATAESFLPGQWRAPGQFDFACGAREPGRLPDGKPCRETANNILLFQARGTAFHAVDFLDAKMHEEYLEAMADRKDPSKRFFRVLPDARYHVWPPDRSTCVSGAARHDTLPVWDPVCLEDSDWAALPHAEEFGREMGPYDIAELVQHELGHALLGGHTGQSGCLEMTPEDFRDDARDPVYKAATAIRRARYGAARPGYSVLFNGNGMDAAWNTRGMFPLDAARLAAGSLGPDCKPSEAGWKGYRTRYPGSSAWIVLKRRDGGTKYVDDWDYALRLMGWPDAAPGAAAAEWFQTGLLPK